MEDLDQSFVLNHSWQWIKASCIIAMSLLYQKHLLFLFLCKMTVMKLVNNLIQKNGFNQKNGIDNHSQRSYKITLASKISEKANFRRYQTS